MLRNLWQTLAILFQTIELSNFSTENTRLSIKFRRITANN